MKKRLSVNINRLAMLASFLIILPASIAYAMTNLDDGIQLQKSEWINSASLKTKSQYVSLKNISDGVFYTPLIKVVIETISDPEVTVANADGITSDGNPYFLYSPPAQIGPGLRTEDRTWVFAYTKSRSKFGHPLDYTTRVWGCTDTDADGYFLEADCGTTPDCDDNDSLNNPGLLEICDNQDNDCDNLVDEGVKTTYFRDKDWDTYGNFDNAIQACSRPIGYVSNTTSSLFDCDDENSNWWLPNSAGTCAFKGNVSCDYPYVNECHPAISNVREVLASLGDWDVNRDSFKWIDGSPRPGSAATSSSKRHLQSIQHFGDSTDHHLVFTMSDETENDSALVGLVQTVQFGSNAVNCGDDCDYVTALRTLNADPEVAVYDHAGGTQMIGKYLFVALEDMKVPHVAPRTGVWSVNPHTSILTEFPINFEYTIDLKLRDYHHTAVAVTKLADGTYLLAACVIKGCEVIQFYKSTGTSLTVDPGFRKIDTFVKAESMPDPKYWSECSVQNANLVVDSGGDIYLVMFGMDKKQGAFGVDLDTCGAGDADSHIYVYQVTMKPGYEIDLEFKEDVPIHNGNDCGRPNQDLGAEKDNFEAGAGLWIGPLGNDNVAVLDTEHYDSCQGKTTWGVTGNW